MKDMREKLLRFIRIKKGRKEDGSSIYIYISIILLFTILIFFLNTYMRAADTVADNLKSSLDTSTLSATIVNVDQLINTKTPQINGYATAEDSWNPQEFYDTNGRIWTEQSIIQRRFIQFEDTLQSNVGLTNSFDFQGGTCGWAADFIEDNSQSKKFSIDCFIVYDITENTVVSYTVGSPTDDTQSINMRTENPNITKRVAGTVNRDGNGKVITSTVTTPDGEAVLEPTIYAKISFPVREASIFRNPYFVGDAMAAESSNRSFRVSQTSTTKIKTNN